MDGGISDMISGVLSNPDSLNKIMTLMPVVSQMMNGSGSSNNPQEKIVETTATNAPAPNTSNIPNTSSTSNISAENLMANAEVMAALKNLIAALNAASAVGNQNDAGEAKLDAVMTMASESPKTDNTYSADNTSTGTGMNIDKSRIENIMNMLGGGKSPDSSATNNINNISDDNTSTIEKTLNTLKNFSSATSPESDHRLKLLLALKPFMKDGRKTKIDSAIKYMNAAKIINMFGKNGFV